MAFARRLIFKRHGVVLILSMIFLVMFSALCASLVVISGTNIQIATNQHKANCEACAESGHQIIRLWLNNVSIPDTTEQELRLGEIAGSLQSTAYQNLKRHDWLRQFRHNHPKHLPRFSLWTRFFSFYYPNRPQQITGGCHGSLWSYQQKNNWQLHIRPKS